MKGNMMSTEKKESQKFDPLIKINKQNAEKKIAKNLLFKKNLSDSKYEKKISLL